MDNFVEHFIQFQDYLAPRLDVYEQAIYVYLLRHTHAEGKREAVVAFKSARKNLAFGVGKAGSPPSEAIVYDKVRSLESKQCLKILSSERTGTRMEVILPSEIPGLILKPDMSTAPSLEEQDFFTEPENRKKILNREQWKCFYCLVKLNENNHVMEHVVSRPKGNNSYRNIVACCRRCNNRKDASDAENFLRLLYRDGLLSVDEIADRLSQLAKLKDGELKPIS